MTRKGVTLFGPFAIGVIVDFGTLKAHGLSSTNFVNLILVSKIKFTCKFMYKLQYKIQYMYNTVMPSNNKEIFQSKSNFNNLELHCIS